MKFTSIIKNTFWLYGLTAAKILIPLVTLPFFTRILSPDVFGVVVFIKSITAYSRIIIEYGFSLSIVKALVDVKDNFCRSSQIISEVFMAQILICILCLFGCSTIIWHVELLKGYELLYAASICIILFDPFLFDFVFRALEKNSIISIRYIITQIISIAFIIYFVKGDADIYFVPFFEILGAIIASMLSVKSVRRLGYKITYVKLNQSWRRIKDSTIYFLSNISVTVFTALNTVAIGLNLTPADVAYWNVSMQLIAGAQMLCSPVIGAIYPQMVKTKNLNIIIKTLYIFVPIILLGCGFAYLTADWFVTLIAGDRYEYSATILRWLLPVLIIGFNSMIFGWPTLGVIDKVKETTLTTIFASSVHLIGLLSLSMLNYFTIKNLVILRIITEIFLFLPRFIIFLKNINKFGRG